MRSERIWGIWVLTSEPIFTKLGKVIEIHDNRRIPLSSMERAKRVGPFPYHGATEIMDYVDDFLFEGLHLLMAEDGSVLRENGTPVLQLVDGKFWVNNHAHVLTGSDDVDTRFLYYALSISYATPWVTGAVQLKINQRWMKQIDVHYPIRSVRESIVLKLKLIDDSISLNRKISHVCSCLLQSLFRSWFLDLDPVKAKAEGKLPFGMNEETAVLFPDSFENSENGELPKGWTWGTLLDISKIWTGGTPKTSESSYWGGDIPWVSGADLSSNDLFAFDSARKITSLGVEKSSTKVLPVGTVMITARGTVGATKITAVPMAMSQTSFGFKAKKGISDALVYQASQETIRQLRSFAYGAVFDTFTQGTIDITKIAIAPLEILQAFGKIVDPLFETMKNSAKEIIELSSTREALLPRLMSGELKVN